MSDPRIKANLGKTLTNFLTYFSDPKHPLYVHENASATNPATTLQLRGELGKDGQPDRIIINNDENDYVLLPARDDIVAWISEPLAFLLLLANRSEHRQDRQQLRTIFGLSSQSMSCLINAGMLPEDIKTTPDKPVDGASFFKDIDNIKNFYKAPFYNIYRRALHEAGNDGYALDWDDYFGADGTETVSYSQNTYVKISIGDLGTSNIDKETQEIYSDKNLNFHDQFAKDPKISTAIGNMKQVLQDYSTQKAISDDTSKPITERQAAWVKMQTDISSLQTQSKAILNEVLALLDSNKAELTKLGINPNDYSAIANEIVSKQEAANISQIPTLSPEPSGETLDTYKQNILDWLKKNEPGYVPGDPTTEGYLRKNFADKIFSQIDGHQIGNVTELKTWIKDNLPGLFKPDIYQNDPNFVKEGPTKAYNQLKDLFNVLGLQDDPPQPPSQNIDQFKQNINKLAAGQ